MRIGFLSYLNSYPFTAAFRSKALLSDDELTFDVPTTLNQKFSQEELDISQISSIEHLKRDYPILPGYGIAAHKKILSVNLYTKQEPTHLSAPIAITSESATAAALLKVLCHHFWNISPSFIPLKKGEEKSHNAFLLIGDKALKNQIIPGYLTVDLAEAWAHYTRLPFVFCVFAIQPKQLEKADKFQEILQAALNWSKQHPQQMLSLAHTHVSLSSSLIEKYLSGCTYHLGEKELEGLALFNALRKEPAYV